MTALLWLAVAGATAVAGTPPFGGPVRIEGRGGFAVVDAMGVADALRFGGGAGVTLAEVGPVAVSVDGAFVYGHAELAGFHWRAGGGVEAELRSARLASSAYLATGVHWFVSRGDDEDRFGLLERAAIGVRIYPGGPWYLGFEPLGLERLPDGDGPPSPLRSRWLWDMTFLAVGVRP